ncbi:MAG TPA: NADH-quinone oxidoreductase subunit H [Victivallales bacterium]|nr:NADH-quinone oxidoreductase subunit H [Victivallales bacterium]HRU01222.1 NADH-quinone oxidoreductase subunit H [Victivallales bacterium]
MSKDLTLDITYHLLYFFSAILFSPLLPGLINRTKAIFGGRKGKPLLQLYYDIFKLLKKKCVYSKTVSWIFRLAPLIFISSLTIVLFIFSFGEYNNYFSFNGDIIFALALMALARFAIVLAALDTGSSFEGMGVSRELMFVPFSEILFLLIVAAGIKSSSSFTVSSAFTFNFPPHIALLLIIALFILLTVENYRLPTDDPNTHLELTMIHEVMVLDYSGPDFAFILYGASIKLWIFIFMISSIVLSFFPDFSLPIIRYLFTICIIFSVSIVIGIIESITARFRFDKVRRMLILASVFCIVVLFILIEKGDIV